MTIQKEELRDFFIKLKKYHRVYQVATEDQRGRLLAALEPTFLTGEKLGVERTFSETLVTSGKDFVDSLFGEGTEVASSYDAQIIFA